ncbi:hypothetical protein S7711_10676 [Stachybotrys chartarum IBT 7711]|uniref:Uncharacterized protein n=1 Tax=Stachybotrys chartarum (strain CBS 109288 / IBT 7711) TaxID=1280523 RepID=A0A084AWN1_STACB|nr:hypothetical protein S7711_10676 [Stachybotrys chartarum IBT 7711]
MCVNARLADLRAPAGADRIMHCLPVGKIFLIGKEKHVCIRCLHGKLREDGFPMQCILDVSAAPTPPTPSLRHIDSLFIFHPWVYTVCFAFACGPALVARPVAHLDQAQDGEWGKRDRVRGGAPFSNLPSPTSAPDPARYLHVCLDPREGRRYAIKVLRRHSVQWLPKSLRFARFDGGIVSSLINGPNGTPHSACANGPTTGSSVRDKKKM